MTDANIISRIRSDADRNLSEIARHRAAIERLEAEQAELQVTLKTLDRLGLFSGPTATAPAVGPKPTVPEMILEVLSRPENASGSKPEPVLNAIRESYDPKIDPNNVRPTMWRMAKDGRLAKRGEAYMLPRKNEDPDDPFRGLSGPSGIPPEAQGREAGPGGGT